MAKASIIRKVETELELCSLVDIGTSLENEIKNLQFRSDINKASILSLAKGKIKESEKSVRLVAKKSNALITRSDKVEFSKNEESYLDLLKAIEAGSAPSELTCKEEYQLTKNIKEVLKLLKAYGLSDSLDKKVTVSIKADTFKEKEKSGELDKSIKGCGKITPSFKVKYEIRED